MSEQRLDLTIELQEPGADEEELDHLTRQLRSEIEQATDVDSARLAPGETRVGAKGDPITIGSILVAMAGAGVFTGLIEFLKAWALRREDRTIGLKAKVGDRELEFTYSPAETSPDELMVFANQVVAALEKA